MEALETPSSAPAGQTLEVPTSGAPSGAGEGAGAAVTTAPPPDIAALSTKLEEITKSYKELQGFSTKTAQDRAELRRELSAMRDAQERVAKTLAEAMKAPHDPDKFLEEWRQNPDKVLKERLKAEFDALRSGYEEKAEKQGRAIDGLTVSGVIKDYRADAKGHPDFVKLEAEMAEITRTPGLAPDKNLPADQYLEALYQVAKNRHAQDALKAAEEAGRKKAEEALANESRTTVAGGGKQVSLKSDPKNMTAAQMKAAIAQADPSLISDGY